MERTKTILRLLAGVVALAAAPVRAQAPTDWTEAVVSVRDPVAATRLFREEGGWRISGKGRMSAGEKVYWRLPQTAGARFVRICAPAATAGCIRFVQFTGVAQRPIRLAARPWDTGGIFSIMIRSNDVQGLFDRAIAMGWWAESEPIAFDFLGSDLRNVVLSGPDGINIAAYERKSPPFTAFPVGRMSQGFNAMRFVRDERASVVFYRDKLGFNPVFDTDNLDPVPTTSNFSIPKNLTPTIIRRAAALRPGSSEAGRVEAMQLVGLDGRDFSQFASPPNLGILSLRYPITDLSAYRAKLTAGGVAIAYESKAVPVPGLGKIDLFAVRDPDGNITEFYQTH
ncbi:MAG: VOC family protein [Sphingobium sp.]